MSAPAIWICIDACLSFSFAEAIGVITTVTIGMYLPIWPFLWPFYFLLRSPWMILLYGSYCLYLLGRTASRAPLWFPTTQLIGFLLYGALDEYLRGAGTESKLTAAIRRRHQWYEAQLRWNRWEKMDFPTGIAAYLVTGYAGTGKDSLYQLLSAPHLIVRGADYADLSSHLGTRTSEQRYQWLVYALPSTPLLVSFQANRHAFADALKEEAFYGLHELKGKLLSDQGNWKSYEHQKNELLVHSCYAASPITLREHYIRYGGYRREQDVNYWCSLVMEKAAPTLQKPMMVTDLRFLNEHRYIRNHLPMNSVATLRVYRSTVKEAPLEVESEHQLDTLSTDYLLVTSPAEFERAVQRFPQYQDHRLQAGILQL